MHGATRTALLALTLASCAPRQKAGNETTPSHPAEAPHWDYAGERGPAHWGEISPEYIACAEGSRQSPIDLSSRPSAPAPGDAGSVVLHVDRAEHVTEAVDNGHTIQVACEGDDAITVGSESFRLAQYHFHAPSEHTVDGQAFPMEMHMVHRSDSGRLAVLGLLVREGAGNRAFETVWSHLPTHVGEKVELRDIPVDVERLLPKNRTAWSYEGSLTTPPCSEGVQWLVFVEPITLSADQIARFRSIISANSRPTQPLNGRAVSTTGLESETDR